MNIVSPFGRISRKGYLAVAVPAFVAIAALDWVTLNFGPEMPRSAAEVPESAWFRWLLLSGPLSCFLTWGLFCACVKRLHDIRWRGFPALLLLWPWLNAFAPTLVHVATLHGYFPWPWRLSYLALEHIDAGVRMIGWALMIVLAIVPGRKSPGDHGDAAAAEAF